MKLTNHLPVLFNVGLRAATLSSKFLLVFVLAKYLTPSDLGVYGLFVVTVAYSMYPLGFEFYTFSSRQIVKEAKENRFWILKNQFALHFFLYLAILPLLYLVFYFDLLPIRFVVFFFVLLVLEHLNQEAMRLLIALQHQIVASLSLFVRQGLWAIVLSILMFDSAKYRELEYVFIAWLVGGSLAFCISSLKILKITLYNKQNKSKINFLWIMKGLSIALPLFVASLSTNLISTVDRYWFESLNGMDSLGAYVFYASLAASIASFIDAGVFSFSYPKMLKDHSIKNYASFKSNFNSMAAKVVLLSVFFGLLLSLISKSIFLFIGREEYINNMSVFYLLITASVLQCIGNIPQYGLYSIDKDRHIVFSSLISIPTFFLIVMILSQYSLLLSIPLSLCITAFVSLIYKTVFFAREFKTVRGIV